MRFRGLHLLLLVFLALGGLAKAQNTDKIIAGYHLDMLSCALESNVTRIEDRALRSYINDHKLSAILIPKLKDQSRVVVGLCFNKQKCSGVTEVPLSKNDYDQLVEYAEHKAFERASRVNSYRQKGNAKDLADARTQLNQYAAELPESERDSTRRFIGSVLADSEPTEADLVPYVQEYRAYVKQKALTALAAMLRSSPLTPGEPLVTVGSASFTALDLEKVNPANVEIFAVGTTRFKGVWIRSSFVFVPQSTDTVTDRTGLGINEHWAKSSSTVIPQLPVNLDVPAPSNLREEQIVENVRKLKGVVTKRDSDSFTIAATTGGPETTILLTENTEVKSHKRGVFRGSKEYGSSYILRGLRLEIDGSRNAAGVIIADEIRFEEQDLRTAQALRSNVDPLEAEINEKLRLQQQEQERLAGQIAENQAVTDQAKTAANKAQQTADYANNRINGLDDFDPIKTITVFFATGSAALSPKAKATIDEAAAWVKTQNSKGWVMAVVGYADTTGSSQRNMNLSERRANAVIYYIVSKYKMPLNRLVQPFGYGQLEPVADNKTREGRSKNRRVEIRLMVNKGISGTVEP